MIQHGLKKGKFVNIPNGIVVRDWNNAKELPMSIKHSLEDLKNKNKFIVGYFGGHALSNALDILLDSAKLLCENPLYQKIVIVMVGKGVEKPRLIERTRYEKIENIVFLDAVDKRCIPKLLEFFDCIYMGTTDSTLYRFGLGLNKFYDAMMAKKPIILSTNAENTIIEKFDCGLVVPANEAEKIKNAIVTIYNLPIEDRKKLGENGKKAVLQYFTYDKLAMDFEKLMGEKKEKNILLINHYAGSPEMGMEFRPYYFAEEWIKNGSRVDIIAADYSHLRVKNPTIGKEFEEEIIDGIHYHWLHTGKYIGNGIKRAITMFEFVWKIWWRSKKIAIELKPDVIITSSTYPLDIYAGQRIRKYRNSIIREEQ